MLDRDLADLYGVKALRLREQVKRNADRFPENFMFRLTEEETDFMVSQNAIPSRQYLGGHLPYVFTEHGVLMLANVLKSERAIKMSIRIWMSKIFQINRIFAKIHNMVTIVKYGADKKKIGLLMERLKNQKSRSGIDAYKYCGTITLAEEPLLIQKESRDEWE